jgi:CDP-diacylglycerol---serine O-phosphatidyltransferase
MKKNNIASESNFIVTLNWADMVSLVGLICALAAIGCIFEQRTDFAVALLCIATAADFIDGTVARHLNLCRAFGRNLDSFIDVVIYLVAPSILLYLNGFNHWYEMLTLILIIIAGIVRLSVFNEVGNVQNSDGLTCYLGMPVYWMTFVMIVFQALKPIVPIDIFSASLLFMLPGYSLLMISRKLFPKPKSIRSIVIALLISAAFLLIRTNA